MTTVQKFFAEVVSDNKNYQKTPTPAQNTLYRSNNSCDAVLEKKPKTLQIVTG
jgi:hypothetical protein